MFCELQVISVVLARRRYGNVNENENENEKGDVNLAVLNDSMR
jgi:hypothetical protein